MNEFVDFSFIDLFLGIFSSVFQTIVPLIVLWQIGRVRADLDVIRALAGQGKAVSEKKVLVPGRGFFTVAKEKRKPKAMSDEEGWLKEQDDKAGR